MTIPEIPAIAVDAAVTRLQATQAFQDAVLAGLIGSDGDLGVDSDADVLAKAWLFQGLDDEGVPYRDPEGTGTSVVVLSQRAEWTIPNHHNTAGFPQLRAILYTDSTRGSDGSVAFQDAANKCTYLFKNVIDKCFHNPLNRPEDQNWSGVRVHSSLAASGLEVQDVPNTNAATVRGERTFELTTD